MIRNRDCVRLILSKLDDNDLLNFLLLNKHVNSVGDETFFHNRVLEKFPLFVGYKPESWKQYYLKINYYEEKIKKIYPKEIFFRSKKKYESKNQYNKLKNEYFHVSKIIYNELDTEKYEKDFKEYYDDTIIFWNILPNVSAADFMNKYQENFRLETMSEENCKYMYDVYKKILEEEVKLMNPGEYLQKAQSFTRTGSYLERFYIPNKKLETFREIINKSLNSQ